MGLKAISISLVILCAWQAWAEEPDWDRIKRSCDGYLEAFSNKDEIKQMTKKLDIRVADRIASTNRDADTAAREIMLDWAVDNRKKLEKKDPALIKQACFYFSIFRERKYLVTKYIRDELTPENVDALCSYLDAEVRKKTKK